MALENIPFLVDVRSKTSILRGFPATAWVSCHAFPRNRLRGGDMDNASFIASQLAGEGEMGSMGSQLGSSHRARLLVRFA